MNLAVITETLHPEIGGVGRVAFFLAQAIREKNAKVSIITSTRSPVGPSCYTPLSSDFRVFPYMRRRRLWFLESGRRVLDVMKRFVREIGEPDTFYHHFPYALPAVKQAYPRSLHVLQIHSPLLEEGVANRGWWSYPLLKILERRFEHTAIQEADSVIVMSDYLKGILQRKYPWAKNGKIVKLKSGFQRFPEPSSCDQSVLRDHHSIPGDARVVIVTRRHVRRTGIEDFVRVVRKYPPKSGLFFIIAGDGYLSPLIRRIVGGQANVKLTGFVDDACLSELMTLADFAFVPSRELECFGLSTLEALQLGLPVVVTDNSASPELIEELGGGIAVPFGRCGFIKALDDIAAGRLKVSALRRERLQNFTFENHAREFLELVGNSRERLAE